MDHESVPRSKWELSGEALSALLRSLPGVGEEAGDAYLRLRLNIVRFFEVRGIAFADEAADDVLNRLARKLDQGEAIENPSTYALGIARMCVLEYRKSPESRQTYDVPESAAAGNLTESDNEERSRCLDRCLDTLENEARELILGYYQGDKSEKIENRRKLAAQLGIPANALRSRAVRLREKLEHCIRDCLNSV